MQSPCQVCPNQSMVTIGGLVGSAAYSVTVGARNDAGPGTVSEPISSQCEFQYSGWEARKGNAEVREPKYGSEKKSCLSLSSVY